MEAILTNIVAAVNDVLWNKYLVLLFLLLGSGIYFTIRTGFVQVRKFGEGMRLVFGNISLKGKEAGKDGMSSFQALATAIAAQVGTGNIAGCASALVSGGPGAVFWMWVSAFFGMATIYGEAVLAQKYGKVEKVAQPVVDTPTAEPVVYISKTVLEPKTAQAGDSFTLTVTLKNSITTKSIRNMLVTVDTGNVLIDLEEDSNIFPVEKIERGGEVELTLHFSTEPAIPSGKYPISFSFKYDSSKTLNLSSNGSTVVEIQQPANMELVMPRFADSVSVGETVPVSFQVMNMGRSSMYNVRCVVSGFGLVPSNTGYIGTMEAGSSKTTKVELYIIALNASSGNENGQQYGGTTGTVTLIYEDETGQEYSQEATFETTVTRPVVQLPQNNTEEEKAEQRVSSWWVSVSILGGVILAAVGTILFIRSKKRRGGIYL